MSSRQFETATQTKAEFTPAHQTESSDAELTYTSPLTDIALGGGEARPQPAALAHGNGGKLARAGHALIELQRSYGNRYVQQVIDHADQAAPPSVIQTKLVLGPANDQYEREADRVAQHMAAGDGSERVMRQPAIQSIHGAEGGAVDAGVQQAIQQARGSGLPLPDTMRGSMEQALGADFSRVRLHTDAQADHLNRSLQARAFTTGRDIFFRRGAYNLGSHGGQAILAHELTHVVQQGGVKTKSVSDQSGRIVAEGSRSISGITTSNDLANSTIQRIGEPKIAIVKEANFLDDGKWNEFINGWRLVKGRKRGAKRDITNKVDEYSRYYLANQNKPEKAKSYDEEWKWEQHKARAAQVEAPPDSLTVYYANSLLSLDGDKKALKKYLASTDDMELSEEDDGCYVVVKDAEKRTKIAKIYEGDQAYEKVPPDTEDLWAERVRPRYRKKGYRGEDESRQYVKDTRNVLTRRYAYVEKNYWQMMEFFMLSHMEGRFQQLMRAAGLEQPRGDTPLTTKSRKWRSQEYAGNLSLTQMAVLHQASGSSDEQRGVSMTSTPKAGVTYVNTGENFRTAKGFRLKIDLSLVPEDEALLLNHYADGGIAGMTGAARDFDTKRYKYNESALHARELYLEFVKPEWVVGIEYHKTATENIPTEMRNVGHKTQWEKLKQEHGANDYEDGFGIALKLKGREKKWKDEKSQAWQEGFSSGATVCAGYDAGWEKKFVLEKNSTIPSDNDQKLAYLYETMVEDTADIKRAAISQYQVGYLRGIMGLPQLKTIKDYKNALMRT